MGLIDAITAGWRILGWRRALAVLSIVAVGVVALAQLTSDQDVKTVQVQVLLARDIRPSIFASGQIVHGDEVRLTSQVIGKIKALYVAEGDGVDSGDLLLAIDDEAYVAQVARNRAAVRLQEIDIERKQLAIENWQRQHDRNRRLFDKGLLDAHAFEMAEHRLNMARIDFASARELSAQAGATLDQSLDQLERTHVRSPIAGIVTSLDVEVGETAIASSTNIPGSGLMVIADPSSILAEVYVDEADVSSVRVGQQAQLVAVAYPQRPLAATVAFIANTAKQQMGRRGLSFRVRLRVADEQLNQVRLRPGMSCRAEIFMATGDKMPALPLRAIVSEEDRTADILRHTAFVFEPGGNGQDERLEGTVQRRALALGRADDEFQEVLAGVGVGERVVVGPARALRLLQDGEAVAVAASAFAERQGGSGGSAVPASPSGQVVAIAD